MRKTKKSVKHKVRIKVTKHPVSLKEHRAKVIYHPVKVELSPLAIEHAPYEKPEPVDDLSLRCDRGQSTPGFWKRLGKWLRMCE